MLQIVLGDTNALRELQSPSYIVGTLLYESGWRKRTETQEKADISGSQLTVSSVPATSFHSQVLMLFTSHLWRRNRGKSFCSESSVVKGPGNHLGQDETAAIICFFALSVPCCFYSWEQVHGDNQRHWRCPWHLMLLETTSLWTLPWVQSIFSSGLVIAI